MAAIMQQLNKQKVEINNKKRERETMLMEKAANIGRIRSLAYRQAQSRRENKRIQDNERLERQRFKHEQVGINIYY